MELPIITNKEELKQARKVFTQLSNKFSKRASKLGATTHDLAKEIHYRDFSFGDHTALSSAVWAFLSFHPFPNGVVNLPEHINIMNLAYPDLAQKGQAIYNQLKEEAEYLLSFDRLLLNERARLNKIIDIKALLSKMAKQNEEKRIALVNYANSIKGWKETVIENGELIVNGVNVGKEANCGIRIGQGIRIHPMVIYVHHDDKENKDFIAVRNYTQWVDSDLIVFDVIEKIPADVISERA